MTYFSGLNRFKVGILRYPYSSPGFAAYASTTPLPGQLQGWILRPWLAATQADSFGKGKGVLRRAGRVMPEPQNLGKGESRRSDVPVQLVVRTSLPIFPSRACREVRRLLPV